MSVPVDAAFVGLGLVALVSGSDRVVAATTAIARSVGLSVFFIGVTLVAVGSSIPEIATAVYAGLYGSGDFLVGHIVGSATSQITLGIGVVSLLAPLSMARANVRVYGGGMVLAMAGMLAVLWSGYISRAEGALLVCTYLAFLAYRYAREEESDVRVPDAGDASPARDLLVGFALVVVGGHLLVVHSESLAASLGVPGYLLGLITGLGTTAPEIVIAAVAMREDRGGIAAGTLLGSNITDPLFSLGVGAAVGGVAVVDRAAMVNSVAYLLVVSALVVAVFYRRGAIGRAGACCCIALYVPAFFL